MYNQKDQIYEPGTTVRDLTQAIVKTAAQGERCELNRICIEPTGTFAIVENSQGSELRIPFDVFNTVFYPSKDQVSKIN